MNDIEQDRGRVGHSVVSRWSEFRAGVAVLLRHVRNSRGRPDRLAWIVRRILRVITSGRLAAVVQRHAILHDLYANYQEWIARYDTLDEPERFAIRERIKGFARRPRFSILLTTYDSPLEDLELAIDSVGQQLYPDWELCIADDASPNSEVRALLARHAGQDARIRLTLRSAKGGIAACTNSALAMATGEFVASLDHDDVLSEQALFRFAEAVNAHADVAILYSDEDKLDAQGLRHAPHFKPDWNPEWIKTTNYVLHLCAIDISLVHAIGGFRAGIDGAQDWDLLLRVAERCDPERIVHVPRVLYHWRVRTGSTAAGVSQKAAVEAAQRRVIEDMLERRGTPARIETTLGGWWLRYAIPEPAPRVSIVIPTRDRGRLLRRCVTSIVERTTYTHYELVLVDHATVEPAARALFAELAASPCATVVHYAGPFKYSAECNIGVRAARGSIIVLLNNDVEVVSPGWLDELVGHALQPDVGMVGALLLYPNDTIQHAGVIFGVNGIADRPYLGYRRGHAGVVGRSLAAQDVSGLVTACAAIRRDVFDSVGGFDESLVVAYNDLDLCLRLSARGYRNVWTPHAELVHGESVSRGYENSRSEQERIRGEEARFRAKWGQRIATDPCYNPNLARRGRLFSLAFPPALDTPAAIAAAEPKLRVSAG